MLCKTQAEDHNKSVKIRCETTKEAERKTHTVPVLHHGILENALDKGDTGRTPRVQSQGVNDATLLCESLPGETQHIDLSTFLGMEPTTYQNISVPDPA